MDSMAAEAAVNSLRGQLDAGRGELIAGDVGLIALKALLENGVGCMVADVFDQPTAIDEAIAAAASGYLPDHGIAVRTPRDTVYIKRLLANPVASIAGTVPRCAIVATGACDAPAALATIAALPCKSPTVCLCFSRPPLESDALLIEPELHPRGLVRAIDCAFELSACVARPVLVYLRERALAMRGTVRARDAIDTQLAAASMVTTDPQRDDTSAAITACNINALVNPRNELAVVCGIAVHAEVQAALVSIGGVPLARRVTVYGLGCTSQLAARELRDAISARRVLVLHDHCELLVRRVSAALYDHVDTPRNKRGAIEGQRVDYGHVSSSVVRSAVAQWLVADEAMEARLRDTLTRRIAQLGASPMPLALSDRIPPRGATIDRDLPVATIQALQLAQASFGSPLRIDVDHPSYRTELGGFLTVARAEDFVTDGLDLAAPAARNGLFLLGADPASEHDACQRAAAQGVRAQVVDDHDVSALAQMIVSLVSAQAAPQVLLIRGVQRIMQTSEWQAGSEPQLARHDRLSGAHVDESCLVVRSPDYAEGLGPRMALASPQHATAPQLAQHSGSWYEVRRRSTVDWLERRKWAAVASVARSVFRVEV